MGMSRFWKINLVLRTSSRSSSMIMLMSNGNTRRKKASVVEEKTCIDRMLPERAVTEQGVQVIFYQISKTAFSSDLKL